MLKLLQQIGLLQWKFFTCCRQEVGKTKLSRIRSRNKRQTPETGNSMHLPVVSPLHPVVKHQLSYVIRVYSIEKPSRLNENKQLLYVGHTLKSKEHKYEYKSQEVFNIKNMNRSFHQIDFYRINSPHVRNFHSWLVVLTVQTSRVQILDWYEELVLLTLAVAVVWSSRKTVVPDLK